MTALPTCDLCERDAALTLHRDGRTRHFCTLHYEQRLAVFRAQVAARRRLGSVVSHDELGASPHVYRQLRGCLLTFITLGVIFWTLVALWAIHIV